jgi:hypothetical protein
LLVGASYFLGQGALTTVKTSLAASKAASAAKTPTAEEELANLLPRSL